MNKTINAFVDQKKLAVVGASRNGKKFGNVAAKELQERGYDVFYVHPEAKQIDGQRTYPNLTSIKGQAECLLISIPTKEAKGVLIEAANNGFKYIWLQQGIDTSELKNIGEQLNLYLVNNKCILMYAEPVRSFHKFHQVVWKMIGQY